MKTMKVSYFLHILRCLTILCLLIIFFVLPTIAMAQEKQPDYPIYIVQEGDSMWVIAQLFNVSVDDLAQVNQITDPNQLKVSMELKVPGLSGVEGKLITEKVPFGENLTSLSRQHQFPINTLSRLNRLVSPASLYVGKNLVLTEQMNNNQDTQAYQEKTTILPNESLLELSLRRSDNPWNLMKVNGIETSWQILPKDVLFTKGQGSTAAGALPPEVLKAEVQTLPLGQGKVASIRLVLASSSQQKNPLSIEGSFVEHALHFFLSDTEENEWLSLQGIKNQMEPGFYPLFLSFAYPNGETIAFSQNIYIQDSNYLFEKLQVTDISMLDPVNTQPEEDEIKKFTAIISEAKLWEGKFVSPVAPEYTECWPSTFGRRRSYNGSGFTYVHSGLDFCGQNGHKIFAPAKGKVVYSGNFYVRGNTTIIDHGWGVFTLYAHQSEINTAVGETVEVGQIIGLVGNTGRVTGPHLHWEVWTGGVQVDPYDWLLNEYPAPDNQ